MSKPMSAHPISAPPVSVEDTLAKVRGIIDEAPASTPPAEPSPPSSEAPAADWRVRPKKIATTQFNVRIRSDLYETLKDLAMYTEGESMTSIAARGIEKEIARMLRERGVKPD
jgi:hypothetical protein